MDQTKLKILLEKCRQGNCTAEELLLIDKWYDSLGPSTRLDKEKAADFLQQLEDGGAGFEARMYEDFLAHLAEQKSPSTENSERHKPASNQTKFKWFKISASVIVLLGLSWWAIQFSAKSRSGNPTVRLADTIQPVNLIGSPGQNRAILTLAGGKTIILDTLQNGLIATQGGINLVNKAGTLNFSAQNQSGAAATPLSGQNMLQTAPGEQYKLILPDGSKVWLNAASRLEFPASFAGLKTRTVKLEGEAYFEVVHDSQQPFMVQTTRQTIEDIGTAFNVSAYRDDPFTKTTLLEGAVQVSSPANRQAASKTLTPGQQASLSNTDQAGGIQVAQVSTQSVIAWKNGYFQFDGEDIYAIMRRVSRWYKVQVVYDAPLPESSMEGSMSRFENVSKVLNIIEKTGLFKFKMEGSTVHVSSQ